MSPLILPKRLRGGRTLVGPRKQRGFIINPYVFTLGGPPSGDPLYDEIMADGPVHMWRHAESTGATIMIDEVAADGSYPGSPSFGNTALYAGGPTCISNFVGAAGWGESGVIASGLTQMTLLTVAKFNSLSGVKPFGPNRDNGSGTRIFQWRTNGSGIEFVRIISGVAVYTVPSVLSTGTSYIIAAEIDSAGNVTIYLNGSAQTGSWTLGTPQPADYSAVGNPWTLGFTSGVGAGMDGYLSEDTVFNTLPGASRQAAYAAAASL